MRRKEKKIKDFLLYVVACSLFISCLSYLNPGYLQAAASDKSVMLPNNPVYDEQTDTTDWDYVYFGNYPQTKMSDDELTADIINADYDENDDAFVNGKKIRRMNRLDANYWSRTTSEGFFDWKSVEDEYVYFKYEPIKWRVLQNEEIRCCF